MNSSHYAPNFISLISSNETISTLVLEDDWTVDLGFIEAILKSKTLLYLILYRVKISEECASKLAESNLRGINVENAFIDQASEEMILTKIHSIEYDDFEKLEEYLK